jgi:hypothetical protein
VHLQPNPEPINVSAARRVIRLARKCLRGGSGLDTGNAFLR